MKRSRKLSNKIRRYRAAGRAVGVAAAVVVAVSGVTFAALQSLQNKLTGNTIQTATASLLLSTDGVRYGNSQAGFIFSGLVPGGPAMPAIGYNIWLKNSGDANLTPKLAVTTVPSNPDNVDLSKVHVILTPGNGTPQSYTLQSLITAGGNGGVSLTAPAVLFTGSPVALTLKVSMDADAFTGTNTSLGNIDFVFTGTITN
jgi:hypothetical protein